MDEYFLLGHLSLCESITLYVYGVRSMERIWMDTRYYYSVQVKPLCDLHVHVLISPCDLGASVRSMLRTHVDKKHGILNL